MLLDFMACKKYLASMKKNAVQGQNLIPFAHFSCFLLDDSAGKTARELWWTNQEFPSVDIIIPPTFFMLMYHLGRI
jgi:hypothetical protein